MGHPLRQGRTDISEAQHHNKGLENNCEIQGVDHNITIVGVSYN